MVPRDDQHQLVEEPRRDTALARPKDVPTHDADVEALGADFLLDHAGIGDSQSQLDPRVASLKGSDHAREDVDPRRGSRANQERAASETIQLLHGMQGVVSCRKHTSGARLEDASGFGEGDLSDSAHEELRAELALQLLDVLGKRRLREMDLASGAGKAPLPSDGEERSEQAEIHWRFRSFRSEERIGPYMSARRKTRDTDETVAMEVPLIFRHFLSPATGCASYVFG